MHSALNWSTAVDNCELTYQRSVACKIFVSCYSIHKRYFIDLGMSFAFHLKLTDFLVPHRTLSYFKTLAN